MEHIQNACFVLSPQIFKKQQILAFKKKLEPAYSWKSENNFLRPGKSFCWWSFPITAIFLSCLESCQKTVWTHFQQSWTYFLLGTKTRYMSLQKLLTLYKQAYKHLRHCEHALVLSSNTRQLSLFPNLIPKNKNIWANMVLNDYQLPKLLPK